MNNISEKIMLSITCLNQSCISYEKAEIREYLYENGIFNEYYPRFIRNYTEILENTYIDYDNYANDKLNVNRKLQYYDFNFKKFIQDSNIFKITDIDLLDFLLNILIAYKCLVLVNMNKSILVELNKKQIIDLRDIVDFAINKHIEKLNIENNSTEILLGLESYINEYICEFFKE